MKGTRHAVLRVENLSVAYRREGRLVPALVDVSVELRAAEAIAIVGESGCGKSTLAAAILHVLPKNAVITGGSVSIDGIDLAGAHESTLRGLRGRVIAMVSQEPGRALNPSMTIGTQVVEAIRSTTAAGAGEARALASELLMRVAIRDARDMLQRYPHQISGGQKQRVLIAMALAGNPRVLVLDEPTTGLDATVEAEVMDVIAALRREGSMAIVFISHNLGLVREFCEHMAVLYAGRIVESGRAGEIFDLPAHPYTADLLDCIPRLDHDKSLRPVTPIEGAPPDPDAMAAGCVFSPRCGRRSDACDAQRPILTAVRGGLTSASPHWTRCLYPERVARRRPLGETLPRVAGTVALDRPLLRVKGLCKSFGGRLVCRDVTFDIYPGETFGLVGESGSGKSTLAHCIAGILTPDAGTVELRGEVLPASIRQRSMLTIRDLQMVFQSPDSTLNPKFTVRETLARSIRKLRDAHPWQENGVERLARAVQFPTSLLDRRPASLSGGQKQRVAIGRAFAGRAALVLCDEPVSALDASVQAGILNLFAGLQRESQVSYLFISHDLAAVRYLSDRIGVMYLGELVEIGTTADVLQGACHPYTNALISASASGLALTTATAGDTGRPRSAVLGCRFAPRCPSAQPVCTAAPAPMRSIGPGHSMLCHLSPDELAGRASKPVPAVKVNPC